MPPGCAACGNVKIIAHRVARQMDGGNAQAPCGNLGPHVELPSLVCLGMRGITDGGLVQITISPGGRSLANADFDSSAG